MQLRGRYTGVVRRRLMGGGHLGLGAIYWGFLGEGKAGQGKQFRTGQVEYFRWLWVIGVCLVACYLAWHSGGRGILGRWAGRQDVDSPQPQAFFKMAKHPSRQKAKKNIIQHGRSFLRTKRYTCRPKSITSSKVSQSRDVHMCWADLFISYLFLNVS